MSIEEDEFSSNLGKIEHWNEIYEQEIINYKDHGDVGEIWFGEDTQWKIIQFIEDVLDLEKSKTIYDAEEGYLNLYGSDYSPHSIQLCESQISDKKNEGKISSDVNIIVVAADFLKDDILNLLKVEPFDVVHDKGTFDAIQLRPGIDRNAYYYSLCKCVKQGGLFIITSCNWTEEELIRYFVRSEDKNEEKCEHQKEATTEAKKDSKEDKKMTETTGFAVFNHIPHKTFEFGG
eukprot:MONOS_14828.1-p1 / transcript=MONOS_14828.1 / gene=MONOS_14828 / organism=Monocercomonoides_exilis_PA203 / gene_product=Methyltransferase-like protein 10 / transcript_product=Methyltransferase-like protein 10 / location=Mono_scaffold01082:371-1384(-) / protein_length=232 / sequence_SO=supercontig / SO=protein_coding / is_pseudo=false